MKLIHASIPADDPHKASEVLAEMMGGEALPFPPAGPRGRMAWSGDGKVSLEIVPRGHLIHRGRDEGEWRAVDQAQRLSEVHLAIGVDRPTSEIVAIAERAGWRPGYARAARAFSTWSKSGWKGSSCSNCSIPARPRIMSASSPSTI